MTLTRIKRIRSYTGYAGYLQTLPIDPCGYIPRRDDVPSPYAHSPVHDVYRQPDGQFVVVSETRHRRYDVFAYDGPRYTEDGATDLYVASRRPAVTTLEAEDIR